MEAMCGNEGDDFRSFKGLDSAAIASVTTYNPLSLSSDLPFLSTQDTAFLLVDEDVAISNKLPVPTRQDSKQSLAELITDESQSEDDRGLQQEDDEDIQDEPQDEQQDDVKISEMHSTLESEMKNLLVCLINEYLSEVITLRQFLTKARQCLYTDNSNSAHKEVFTWMLRCMLESGNVNGNQVHRMATFLEENGITKPEIEASSAAIKNESGAYIGAEPDIGEKRKRREKKSISRGLRSAPNKWSKAESQMLIRLVHENGDKSWKRIAEQLGGGKTGAQCAQHWKRVLSPQIRKGSWDDQEEELLLALVERYGQSWKNIAGEIKTRTDIQCRYQYQKSCLSRQCAWQDQEDALLMKKVAQMLHEGNGVRTSGNLPVAWVDVAKFIARAKLTKIPRTALECKQRWYARSGNGANNNSININMNMINSSNNIHNNIHNNTISNNTGNNIGNNTISSHQFHNINYSNINNSFSMAAAPPPPSFAVTPSY